MNCPNGTINNGRVIINQTKSIGGVGMGWVAKMGWGGEGNLATESEWQKLKCGGRFGWGEGELKKWTSVDCALDMER